MIRDRIRELRELVRASQSVRDSYFQNKGISGSHYVMGLAQDFRLCISEKELPQFVSS